MDNNDQHIFSTSILFFKVDNREENKYQILLRRQEDYNKVIKGIRNEYEQWEDIGGKRNFYNLLTEKNKYINQINNLYNLQIQEEFVKVQFYEHPKDYGRYQAFYYIKLQQKQFQQLIDQKKFNICYNKKVIKKNQKLINVNNYQLCENLINSQFTCLEAENLNKQKYSEYVQKCFVVFYKNENGKNEFLLNDNQQFITIQKIFNEPISQTLIREFNEETGQNIDQYIDINKLCNQNNFVTINGNHKTFIFQVDQNFNGEKNFSPNENLNNENNIKIKQQFQWFIIENNKKLKDHKQSNSEEVEKKSEIGTRIQDNQNGIYNKIIQLVNEQIQ